MLRKEDAGTAESLFRQFVMALSIAACSHQSARVSMSTGVNDCKDSSSSRSNSSFNSDFRCNCSKDLKVAKYSVARICILEKESLKFFPEACKAYFKQLRDSIEENLSEVLKVVPDRVGVFRKISVELDVHCIVTLLLNSPNSSTCTPKGSSGFVDPFTSFHCLLEEEIKRIEKALYLPNRDEGSQVPLLFRDCNPLFKNVEDQFNIEEDGFEIVKVVVPRQSSESDPSDDDDDSV